jgi:hypothetical protein
MGVTRGPLLFLLALGVIGIALFVALRLRDREVVVGTAPTAASAVTPARTALTATALAALPKPRPVPTEFLGCPPTGDGGDPRLNELKARADSGAWVDVPFETILALPWPKPIERRDRDRWARAHAAEIARYEGAPVRVEGYFASGSVSGPESVNCHGADADRRDWHVWLAPGPGPTRQRSIVVEPTPVIRARHPGWTMAKVRALARDSVRVRVSGWLLFDPEHPEQIGRTRGTIWEIHPVLAMEVLGPGGWITLDDYVARRVRRARTR